MRKWQEVIDDDLPGIRPVTEDTRQLLTKESSRYRGSVRLSTGRVYTDGEYAERKLKVASLKLP